MFGQLIFLFLIDMAWRYQGEHDETFGYQHGGLHDGPAKNWNATNPNSPRMFDIAEMKAIVAFRLVRLPLPVFHVCGDDEVILEWKEACWRLML